MSKVFLAISDEKHQIEINRALTKAGYKVITASNPPPLFEQIKSYDPHVICLDAALAESQGETIRQTFPRKPIIAWMPERSAVAAVNLIAGGVFDCICPPINPEELADVIRYAVNKTSTSAPTPGIAPKTARRGGAPKLINLRFFKRINPRIAGAVLGAVILVTAGFFAVRAAGLNKIRTYAVDYQNPTGIFWSGGNLLTSDWYTQSIYQYKIGKNLKLLKTFYFPEYNPYSIAFIDDLLWLTGTDGFVRCYNIATDRPVLNKTFKAPGYSPSGLCVQGGYLWSMDADANMIYQHALANPEKILANYPYPGLMPVGFFWDGQFFWSADGRANKIYKHHGPGKGFQVIASFTLTPEGGGILAGLSGGKNTLWLIFTGEPTKILCYPIKKLQ